MPDSEFRPRPKQREILDYSGGEMGISAVPGSGKTHILSYLAAQLVAKSIDDEQEVLIVTMMNSAVDNFAKRIAGFVQADGLLPSVGYRVRTLHGLAVDIVRERPGLVGLSERFGIIDEREARRVLDDIVRAWVSSHPHVLDAYLADDIEENKRAWVAREHWPDLVTSLAIAFIKRAKDRMLTPRALAELIAGGETVFPLARMGLDVYEFYQRALSYRGAVDFDDLIMLALRALQEDEGMLERLRHRWPFILEDEAQDSSRLQQEILHLLAGPEPNWVRVGDPNQSIHTTFTTADPALLRDFIASPGVRSVPMPNSGRSSQAIIDLANYLVDWATTSHPSVSCRDAFEPQHIEPTPAGDPQPNPSSEGRTLFLDQTEYTSEMELARVVDSLERWLPEHADETVAVLVPRNVRGFQVTEALSRRDIPFVELLQSTISTRRTTGALVHVLRHLVDTRSAAKLARVWDVWRRDEREHEEWAERNRRVANALKRIRRAEDYLWPRLGRDWLEDVISNWGEDEMPHAHDLLIEFRELVRRWENAASLPVDQLLLMLGQDLFDDAASLALAYKLANVMRGISDDNPTWRLSELTEELAVVARNERRFLGFDADDTGFEPPKGAVTVTTMHKAKGLEWDRVHLMSVNNYGFPSDQPNDSYIAEKWFVRDGLNLEAEALAQLDALADPYVGYEEGRATLEARGAYVMERLRLLYVGITRARRDLIITWNNGRGRLPSQPAIPFIALEQHWKESL